MCMNLFINMHAHINCATITILASVNGNLKKKLWWHYIYINKNENAKQIDGYTDNSQCFQNDHNYFTLCKKVNKIIDGM